MDNLSILVLDDNPTSVLIISKILAKFNFRVLPFQTAEAALDSLRRGVAKEEELDLVLAEVHLSNKAMGTLANSELFHHILNELQVPLITMCAYGDEEAVSECMALGASFHVLKPLNSGTFNILKQRALEHRSRRAIPEGSSILNKTKRRMDSSSTKKPKSMFIPESSNVHKSESEKDEEPDVWKACGYSKKPGWFKWSIELHEKFLEAVEVLGGKSATPKRILQRMNVKDLTSKQIASHLQKHRHRLLKHKAKQGGQDQWNASMKPVSELIISAYSVATSKSNNQLATTQTPITPIVASAIREKYPIRLWTPMEESSAEAAASKTNTCTSAIYRDDTKSVWDKYEKGLQKRLSLSSKWQLRSAKSKAVSKDKGIANKAPYAAGEKGYGAPASAPLESSGSSSLLTSLLDQVGENSRTKAAGNNGDLENITLHEDIMNREYTAATSTDGLLDLGSSALLDDTNKSCTAEMELSTFWVSQLEGSQEHQDLVPDNLLQVDDAWNNALQSVSLTNMDARMAQEAANGDAPAYDPVQQFAEGNAFWNWSPQVGGDYGMLP